MDIFRGVKALVSGGKSDIQKKELGLPFPDWQLINGMWVQAADNTETYINKGYRSIPYVYAIISRIIDKASDAPGQIMRVVDQDKAKAYKLLTKGPQNAGSIQKAKILKAQAYKAVERHDFLNVLRNPNPMDTEKTLKEQFLGYLQITGNAYIYAATPGIGVNATKPKELWVIPSPCVEIVQGTRQKPVGGYKISYYGNDVIDPGKICHMKYFNPVGSSQLQGDWLYGMAPLRAARSLLSHMDAADHATGTLFKNMGPAGILSGEGEQSNMSEENAIAIKDKFRAQHMGTFNAGDIIVTPAKVTWQQIGVSPVDLKLIEADGNFLQKLCSIFRFPKELISGDAKYANSDVADKQLITTTVIPLLRRLDDTLTKFIQEAYQDSSIEYVSDTQYYSELAEDRAKQAEWLAKADWLTVDEKRAVQDYGEYEASDNPAKKLFKNPSLAPIEDVAAGSQEIDTEVLTQNDINDYE